MTDSQKILELTKQNNGIITTAMVVRAGISRGTLKYLSDTGGLEKVQRGVYTLPEVWEDEFVNIQSRFKRGIFSLETALFLCDLTDRTPSKFHTAITFAIVIAPPFHPFHNSVLFGASTSPVFLFSSAPACIPSEKTGITARS